MTKAAKRVVNDVIKDSIISSSDLTDAEKNFILYYMESQNVQQSCLKAYPNIQKKCAYIYGYNVLHKPAVEAEIKKIKKIMKKGYDIDPSKYIEFMLKGANSNIDDYIKFAEEEVPVLNDDGTKMIDNDTGLPITKKINRMHFVNSDKVDTSLIQRIRQGKDGISIELVDKLKCWDSIRKFMNWQMEEKKKEETNTFIDALKGKVKSVWEGKDTNKDLEEILDDK